MLQQLIFIFILCRRNDVISHVREAAAVALHQIGGPEVEEVMRVTRVLAEEIRTLTEMKS